MPNFALILENLLVLVPPVLAIIAGTLVLNAVMRRALRILAKKASFDEGDLLPIRKLGGWGINGAALVLLLGVLGFNLGGLWAMMATVLGMVAIGFVAVWSVLSNVSCTLIILINRPFEIGDDIEFAGEPVHGRVVDLNFLYTTLRAEDGSLFQVPNNLFVQKVIKRRPSAVGIKLSDQLASEQRAG